MRDFRLDIDAAGTPALELGHTGDIILLEEGTTNLIPNALSLSEHSRESLGATAEITDLGSAIVDNEAHVWFSRTGATGSDHRLYSTPNHITTYNTTLDTAVYYTFSVEFKPVQWPAGQSFSFYAEGPVLSGSPYNQSRMFSFNPATTTATADNGCTVLTQQLMDYGYVRLAVLVPPSFWTGAGTTCFFFVSSGWSVTGSHEYRYRLPQFEQKLHATGFADGTRSDRYGPDPSTIVDGRCDTIANNLYLSLMVPRGSWFHSPDFGSRLHLLRREKNTERTAYLAREYCREALQWLLDAGRASAIDITVQSDRLTNPYRLNILVEATQADGMQLSFSLFQEVA